MRRVRRVIARLLVPVMKITGFRFSKAYRNEETAYKAFIYHWVDTVYANILAE